MLLYQNHTEWLQAIAVGDEKAFTALYREYSPNIFQVAMMYSRKDIGLAEEFVQRVFVRIWEKRDTLYDVRNIEDYIFILARNIIFDYFKKEAHELTLKKAFNADPFILRNDTERMVQEREYGDLLQNAIAQLPSQQRTVYVLAKEEGMSHKEIAERLQLSKSTIQSHMKLAMRSLRKYVGQHLFDYILVPLTLDFLLHKVLTN